MHNTRYLGKMTKENMESNTAYSCMRLYSKMAKDLISTIPAVNAKQAN